MNKITILKKMRYIVPCVLTIGNLFCGYMSILFTRIGQFSTAAWLIFLSMLFDIMDGRAASLTKGTSRFGAELDSLGDLVSFGVAPAFLMFRCFFEKNASLNPGWAVIISFFYLMCGSLRLARFNIRPTKNNFEGLPIPGAAALLASLVIFFKKFAYDLNFTGSFFVSLLALIMIITGWLMVSTITYPASKKRTTNLKVKLLAGILVVIGMLINPPVIFLVLSSIYVISGPVYTLIQKIRKHEQVEEDCIIKSSQL